MPSLCIIAIVIVINLIILHHVHYEEKQFYEFGTSRSFFFNKSEHAVQLGRPKAGIVILKSMGSQFTEFNTMPDKKSASCFLFMNPPYNPLFMNPQFQESLKYRSQPSKFGLCPN